MVSWGAGDEGNGFGVHGLDPVQGVHLTCRARELVALHHPPPAVAGAVKVNSRITLAGFAPMPP